jgi:hypothetical protein
MKIYVLTEWEGTREKFGDRLTRPFLITGDSIREKPFGGS